ncbi:macrophage mannose receptor 1-like [Limulus polyphemus]|uniref:Macrophage mannose receptor 1-like n=1 Tax=Limulus polyphemus TaxID=6850 RepID=A0ABM1RXI3_LIMPO|nr:macrophage mannose receptor 1-like [Limulus polyphemus]
MLLYNPFNVWIGLSKLSSAGITSRIFGWVDNTRVSFVNWAPGSPRYYWKRCVTMIAASIRAGKWIDSSCSENQGYVCQQYKDQNLPEQNVNYYCNGSLSNYVSYGQGCYRVYNSKNTWKDAEYYCQEEKGHLASVVSPYEQAFLHLFLKKTSSNTWIGFGSKTDENRFRWTDQWPVYFTNWGRGQPVTSTSSSQQLCVSFLKNGPWNVTSCEEKLPFVCKVNIDDPPIILEPVEGECPNNLTDWLDVEGHYCYYIDNKSVKQWGEASRKCLIQNATLASFHSEHELKIMQPYLSLAKTDLWIGLVQKADGGFRWMDYSPVDYTNWGEGEPNDVSVDHCVLLRTQDTTWKTMKCNVNVGHICMVKKVPGNSHKKEKDEEHSSKVLASWAVVVICLSIVTLVAVITSLCFYRLKKISTSTKLPLSFDNIMHTSGSDTLSYPALSSSSVTPPTS